MYSFDFDARDRVLHIRAEGMWSLATLAGFSAEALVRGAALKLRYRRFALLCDVRALPVQTGEIAKGLEILMGKCSDMIAAPMAVSVGSMLSKLQAERVLKNDWTRVFLDHDAALAWLNEEWCRAAA